MMKMNRCETRPSESTERFTDSHCSCRN